MMRAGAGDALAHDDPDARFVHDRGLDDSQLERRAERDEILQLAETQRSPDLLARGVRGRDGLRARHRVERDQAQQAVEADPHLRAQRRAIDAQRAGDVDRRRLGAQPAELASQPLNVRLVDAVVGRERQRLLPRVQRLAVAAAAPQLQPAIEQRDGALARGAFDLG
jgi:hypothetical protein